MSDAYSETAKYYANESYIGKVDGKEAIELKQQYLIGENGLELMSHHLLKDIN